MKVQYTSAIRDTGSLESVKETVGEEIEITEEAKKQLIECGVAKMEIGSFDLFLEEKDDGRIRGVLVKDFLSYWKTEKKGE